jgi:hypothetical protein
MLPGSFGIDLQVVLIKSTKKKVRLRVLAAARRSPPQPAAARRSPPQPAAARATIGTNQL